MKYKYESWTHHLVSLPTLKNRCSQKVDLLPPFAALLTPNFGLLTGTDSPRPGITPWALGCSQLENKDLLYSIQYFSKLFQLPAPTMCFLNDVHQSGRFLPYQYLLVSVVDSKREVQHPSQFYVNSFFHDLRYIVNQCLPPWEGEF